MHLGQKFTEECKARVFQAYFPLFVKERLIKELAVFCFQKKECPLREFLDDMINAADFLRYSATEEEIVDCILMDLHPGVLAHAVFLPRPPRISSQARW
jgi:hypothetical protein